ncbi:MAG TPA: hypothetical protein VNV88_04445, partial [Candidatus Solibacter sp.]|nr:hypothetical protein [Candidatus Solibacter sp.]
VKARRMRNQYQVAYLFSTKYDRPAWFTSRLWTSLNRRYFDYHTDVDPETAAAFLGGNIVFLARRKAEWVAIVEIQQPATSVRNRGIGTSGDRVIGKSSEDSCLLSAISAHSAVNLLPIPLRTNR